ncbi:MAG: protein kinase [Caldimonas sp.]
MTLTVSAPAASARAVGALGRFDLRHTLGEGAQATVWLGFDRRLEREVAVKLMRSNADVDPVAVGEWLREARSVSRLTHPNIVPVFEADVHERQPYLVYEYVAGPTLAQLMRSRGALPAHEGVSLLLGVLDALHAAHAAGVVHRDLKPSNVLVGTDGRARVMDFGIAARIDDAGNRGQIVGTPGYMSPEATQGGVPTAAMDLFSVGVMLVEVLSGSKLVTERDPYKAMHRVANEDLRLPEGLSSQVDDALRAVLRRALERAPARRWQTAAEFRDALQAWLAPAAPVAPEAVGRAAGGGTLDFLLRRMRHKSDFPALSDSVMRIQRVADSETQSLSSLSSEILKDVALTNKLLRMVNNVNFSQAAGSISTVSRAVALVGFAGIRNMAMSLVLLEHMHDKAHANQLKEEFLHALFAGMLASELGVLVRDSEEAFIGAMFLNLGRLLTEYYFPEEARQVRGIVTGTGRPGELPVSEEVASARVLGLSFEALGLGVARAWGLPDTLQACMRKPKGEPPPRVPTESVERLRWLTLASNQIADTLLRAEPELAGSQIAEVAKRYARSVGLDVAEFEAAATSARHKLAQTVQALGLQVAVQSPARRLYTPVEAGDAAATVREEHASLTPHTLQATLPMNPAASRAALDNACEVLAAGIHDITDTLVGDFKLNDVLRMILETMYRALGFRHVVFCLRDLKSDSLTGRIGFGDGAEAIATHFKVPLKLDANLFTAVCVKGADVVIADATVPHIASRLPAWYREKVNAPAFLLLPVLMIGAPFALIYADKPTPGGVELGDKELSLLRTLRNQAVMAFKQAA